MYNHLKKPTLSRSPFALSAEVAARPLSPEPCAVLLLDSTGRVTAANAAARILWQTGEGEIVGEHFAALIQFDFVSDDPDWLSSQWEVLLVNTLDKSAALTALPREGAPRDVLVRLERGSQPVGGYIATVQPPPAAAGALAGSAAASAAAALDLLSERGIAGIFDLHLKAQRVNFSPGWKKILGYSAGELPDTLDTWHELIHPDDSAAAPDKIGKKLTVGTRPFNVEFRMRHRQGRWVWVQCVGLQMLSASGELERVIGLHLDVTERKEIEEASLANDARMQELSGRSGPLGSFELDFTGQIFWLSAAWKKTLGYAELDLDDDIESFATCLPDEQVAGGVVPWIASFAPGQGEFLLPTVLRGKDGAQVSVLLGAHRTYNRRKEISRVVGFICELPVPSAPPEVLPATLAAEAFDTLGEAVVMTDVSGKIIFLNAAALTLLDFGREFMLGRPLGDVLRLVNRETGRATEDPVARALAAHQPLPLFSDDSLRRGPGVMTEGIRPDAESTPDPDAPASLPIVWTARAAFSADGKARGVILVFRDPQSMTLTPDELVRANRFESLGHLAGGIAHDFNNLLTTVLGGISLARDTRDLDALLDSEKACLAAKALSRQLLTFAKGGTGLLALVSPRELLEETSKIASAGSASVIAIDIAPDVAPVRVERAEMLQVFQNLIVNALQAMPPPPHGARVELRASNLTVSEGQVPGLPAGDYVEFEVRDNGSGIPPEHLPRIFDPFFSTKKHGTGLGLATVLSLVRKHGGQIGIDTALSVGTAFTVFLPQAEGAAEMPALRAPSLRFGTGRVLMMDDDSKILNLTAGMLESLDYKYDLAKNGEEAISLYQRYLNIGRPYDAVIMDITVIGGMGGEEAFKILRQLDPEVRAIVSSGYDNDDMAQKFLELGFCGYLTKPYRLTDLGKILKTVLG